ncbi:MAG: outer membrane protein assembly factor BamA [bacterium]
MKNLTKTLVFTALLILVFGEVQPAEKSQKPKIRKVTYSGNITYEDSRLEGLLLTRPSRFLAPSRFHPEIFQDDLETLVAFYKQNGFLQVRIIETPILTDSLKNDVDIAIHLEEGARTYVEGVTVFGNHFLADSVLMRYIRLKKGDPLRRPVIEDAVVALLSLYAEHGFLEASVTPKVQVNDSAHLALVDFVLNEGVRSRVGSIGIVGADKTRPNVILRESSFAKGDTVKYSELIGSQRRLYLTGLFESVFVRPAPSATGDSTEKEIRVEVKEKQSGEISFSIGYGTVEKFRGRTELSISNLAGTARKAGIGVEANFIKQGVSMSFSEPWTLGTRWKSDLSVFGQLRQEPAYHAEVIGGKLTVGRRLGLRTSVAISYRLENTNLSRIDLASPVEELDPRIRSLTLVISQDTRDNLFDPSVGWYANWSNEIAGSFLQGSNTFAKSILTLKRFLPLGRQAVIGSALEFGWMESFGNSDEIPLSERFYTGGPTSLRGFGYQMVGPLDANGEPLGGQLKLVWNLLELRRSIYRMVGGAVFVECGNVWSKPKQAQISDLRVNLGTGLRVNSPLGILRLDYGINPDRRADEPSTKVFFSMGQAF